MPSVLIRNNNISKTKFMFLLGQAVCDIAVETADFYWRKAHEEAARGNYNTAAYCAGFAYGLVAYHGHPAPEPSFGDAVFDLLVDLETREREGQACPEQG